MDYDIKEKLIAIILILLIIIPSIIALYLVSQINHMRSLESKNFNLITENQKLIIMNQELITESKYSCNQCVCKKKQ